MKKTMVFLGLLLVANMASAYVIYYPPAYYNPYIPRSYSYPFYNHIYRSHTYPTDINSCPLQGGYYDAGGNWIPAQRVCPSTTPQVNINVNR